MSAERNLHKLIKFIENPYLILGERLVLWEWPSLWFLCVAENLDGIISAARTAHRSNDPHRLLKSIMDMLKERYATGNYEPVSLEEIFAATELTELQPDLRLLIQDALHSSLKVAFYPEEERYLFKPALGHGVRNRKQLLAKLRDNELRGLGGITDSDIKEAVHRHDKAMKVCFSKMLFYNYTMVLFAEVT